MEEIKIHHNHRSYVNSCPGCSSFLLKELEKGYKKHGNYLTNIPGGVIITYPTSASGIIVLLKTITKYCQIVRIWLCKNNQKVAISWVWYNGSYTMAAKPIKSPELHHTMIQFLIMWCGGTEVLNAWERTL